MNSVISNNEIAGQFPILKQPVHQDKRLVYLDSAATAQKPLAVIQSMNAFYEHTNANIHRGIHALAEAATEAYENARTKTARFIGVADARQLIFTRNTTESINLIAYTWGRKFLNKGDLVVLTEMEHHSNLVPWYMLAEEKELRIEFVRVRDDGTLDMRHYHDLLEKKPRLVSFTHMSNVLGTINPAKEMIQDAHRAGAVVVIDGAQAVPHFGVNLTDLEPDFYAFSGHKMCGPTGIGVLYGKMDLLNAMPPFMGGGDMIKKVTFEGFSTNDVPYKFEAGTPAIAEGIGMGAAVDYLESVGMDAVFAHEQELTQYAFNVLADVKGLRIIGPGADVRGGVISFTLEGIHPHDVAQILDSEGIAVRAGHHCAMPLHQRFNIPATTRASLYLYNTKADLDALRKGLDKVIEIFA
ncbi:cysteine desulfurase [Pelolinea submarina]|uniref:cysteine desulfurase n=1 Tax=Pelolinea submarina TaxID=913107 RepID=A0A347ZTS1_9CHLR|nr:cysteine desulfurase [Pelolinea submarina]REG10717.1 cysteine desulfurase/selenocysteine lyase [Pelolinea submarina]BBB48702.1 cysteine desulfurase /selenocysteine lyase [Pelolinea submarina]